MSTAQTRMIRSISRRIVALGLALALLTGCGTALLAPVAAQEPDAGGQAEAELNTCERIAGACVTEELLVAVVTYATYAAEMIGVLVIAVGVLRALLSYVPHLFRAERDHGQYKEDIRLQLGKSLALGLEFQLGADILKTSVAPTWPIIAQLAAIIVLRTVLNFFLEREIRQVEQRRADLHLDEDQARPGVQRSSPIARPVADDHAQAGRERHA